MQTGRKILNLRCDRKITQQSLALACNITPSALSKIEAGANAPRANVIWNLAKQLGVTVEYLMDESMPYPYQSYSYRRELQERNEDPGASVRMNVTREEQAFVTALRDVHRVAREIAFAIPESSLETVRLIHFLLNHVKIDNPTQKFFRDFESFLTTGGLAPEPAKKPDGRKTRQSKPARPGKKTARRGKKRSTRSGSSSL